MFSPEPIVIAGTGALNVAPAGVTMPTKIGDTLDPDFVHLGYSTSDGAKFTDSKTTNSVRPWQSFYPARIHVTERDVMIETTLLQWQNDTVRLAFGGGTITEVAPGEFRYTPPAPEDLDIRAVVLDFRDGAKHYRIGIERAFVSSNTESDFTKTGPSLLPVTLMGLANGEDDPWFLDTNDPAFAPSGS